MSTRALCALLACWGHDPNAPHFGQRCSIDLPGKLGFVPGVTGGAATINGGREFPMARVHTALLRTSIFNPKARRSRSVVPAVEGSRAVRRQPHRILGGPYDLGVGDVSRYAQDRYDSGDPRMHFIVFFGRNLPRPRYVEARSVDDHQPATRFQR